jgi:hypothetical protein
MTISPPVVARVFGVTGIGIAVYGTKGAAGVLFLGCGQQLIRFEWRDPEHRGQIRCADAVLVNQLKDLLRPWCGVGHHLPASEGKQPGAQPVRIGQQGPRRVEDQVRDTDRVFLPAGEGAAVGDERGDLGIEQLDRRPHGWRIWLIFGLIGAVAVLRLRVRRQLIRLDRRPHGWRVWLIFGLVGAVAVLRLRVSQQLIRLGRRDPEHRGQILRPDAEPVYQVKDFAGFRLDARQDLHAGKGEQPGAQLVWIGQLGLRGVEDGARSADGVFLLTRDGAAVGDQIGKLGVEGNDSRPDLIIGPLPV